MKKNRNLILLVVLIIIVSGMARAHPALAMSDKIIKQRIEDEATGTFHPSPGNLIHGRQNPGAERQ